MNSRTRRTALLLALALVIGAVIVGGVVIGRVMADPASARAAGYRAGHTDGYFAGLRDGEAQGVLTGRALQEASTLPRGDQPAVREAFTAGYAAGSNDAFGDFDGGWALGRPYVVTVEAGKGQVTYRMGARTPMQPHVSYYLCADGRQLCQAARQ